MIEIHGMPGHLIRRMNQIAVSIFQDRMKALGLDLTPVQFAAMATLAEHPDVDQATLAGLIAYDRATIGGVVDRLETKGLVVRSVRAGDRRAREVRLSDDGRALLARLLPEVRAAQTDILPGLTPDEAETFLRLAARVAEAGNQASRAPMVTPDRSPAIKP